MRVVIDKAQLAKLTREEKLALLEAIEEKKRRAKEQRVAFIPHAGQLEIIKDPHAKRLLICGNGFGKTAFGVNEVLWALDGFNPVLQKHTEVPAKVVVVLDSPEKVGDVWIPELKKWRRIEEDQMQKRGKPYVSAIQWGNGSTLRFYFHLQEEMALESIEADFVVFDEPPPRPVWVALLRAGRRKNRSARYLLLGTPIAQAWLREYYTEWERGSYPDTMFFKMSTELNKANLAEGYIEEFSRHLTEHEKRTRLHGDFFNTEGMALSGIFRREHHVIAEKALPPNYKQEWPHVIAVDPHPNKPLVACMLTVSPEGNKYYVAEFSQKVVPRDFGKWLLNNWIRDYRIVDIVVDNFGSGDYTGGEGFKSFIEVMNSMGIRARATSYDEKKDDEFLERIQEALYIPEGGTSALKILGKCSGIVRDIENVQWKKLKGTESYQPKLEIGNKDFLACLKYALAANLVFDNSTRKIRRAHRPSPWAGNGKVEGYMKSSWASRRKNSDNDDW